MLLEVICTGGNCMEVLEFIKYLNSKDCPHIPITTLGVYTGTDDAALSRYCNG